jgi:hypothetical protein
VPDTDYIRIGGKVIERTEYWFKNLFRKFFANVFILVENWSVIDGQILKMGERNAKISRVRINSYRRCRWYLFLKQPWFTSNRANGTEHSKWW